MMHSQPSEGNCKILYNETSVKEGALPRRSNASVCLSHYAQQCLKGSSLRTPMQQLNMK